MESSYKEQISISSAARKCEDGYRSLFEQISETHLNRIFSRSECLDELGRFRLWANNIGALLPPQQSNSLDQRLQSAGKIRLRVVEILIELDEALQDLIAILTGQKKNRTSHDEDSNQTLSEFDLILEAAKHSVTTLMKISISIREATTRDRYLKAEASKTYRTSPFLEYFDISHVGHKYPKLEKKPWLQRRLTKAISRRREYLRYCKSHRDKFESQRPDDTPQSKTTSRIPDTKQNFAELDPVTVQHAEDAPQHLRVPKPQPQLDDRGAETKSEYTNTVAQTKASTLQITNFEQIEDINDVASQTSYATTIEDDSENALQVPRLTDIANTVPFECPFCWGIQNISRSGTWKKHVFSDLRPYMCTFEGCDLKLFPSRHSWFDHEMSAHRHEWSCKLCDYPTFQKEVNFEFHMRKHIPDSSPEQMEIISEASRQPVAGLLASDCPFCDWHESLRQLNSQIDSENSIAVTPRQFRNHVGYHMEQLALFALPRSQDGQLENDSDKPVHSGGSQSVSGLTKIEWGSSASPDLERERDHSTGRNADAENTEYVLDVDLTPATVDRRQPIRRRHPWVQCFPRFPNTFHPPLPRNHISCSSITQEGVVYAMGGNIPYKRIQGDLWKIDLSEPIPQWFPVLATGEDPGPRAIHGFVLFEKSLYLYGGRSNGSAGISDHKTSSLYRFDTSTQQWSYYIPEQPGPKDILHYTMTVSGSCLYLYGGFSGSTPDNSWPYSLSVLNIRELTSPNFHWTGLCKYADTVNELPKRRWGHTMVTWKENLYLFGGNNWSEESPFNDVWEFNTTKREWLPMNCSGYIPIGRWYHTAAVINDMMFVFGGRIGGREASISGQLAALNLDSRRWFKFPDLGASPPPCERHSMFEDGSLLYIFGGEAWTSEDKKKFSRALHILDTSKIKFPLDQSFSSNSTVDLEKETPLVLYCEHCDLPFLDPEELNQHHIIFPHVCKFHRQCLSPTKGLPHVIHYEHIMCFIEGCEFSVSLSQDAQESLLEHMKREHFPHFPLSMHDDEFLQAY